MKPIISPAELLLAIDTPGLVLMDTRVGPAAKTAYLEQHLKGARYADLEFDLATIGADAAQGGRHPLPAAAEFGAALGRLGITPGDRIIVYDDKYGGNAAARFWWMLRAAGHAQVQVLDGGLQAALAAGVPTDSGLKPVPATDSYPFRSWALPLADIGDVEKAAADAMRLVIDVRDAYRYNGENEPIDLVAGHIPGAVNIPFTENLRADGTFRPAEELSIKYKAALAGRPADAVIVHCGSGVTACHTLLAMDLAGLPIPALYVGSWSEWSRTGRPIGRKS